MLDWLIKLIFHAFLLSVITIVIVNKVKVLVIQ